MEDDAINALLNAIETVRKSKYIHSDKSSRQAYANEINEKTEKIEKAITFIISENTSEKFEVFHYGANIIHPSFLVYWVSVQTDKERERLKSDKNLMKRLHKIVIDQKYPEEGREQVKINFESQETIDRDWGGNWFEYLK